MQTQSYKNHVRYYTPHHFVFLPVMLILIIAGIWCMLHYPFQQLLFGGITISFIMIAYTGIMLRQHYTLGNQDRILRLEMRLRYYQLTHQQLELLEPQLSFKQLAALRFASDEELPALVQRTINERLTPDVIKKSIIYWQPDYMRV